MMGSGIIKGLGSAKEMQLKNGQERELQAAKMKREGNQQEEKKDGLANALRKLLTGYGS